MIDKLRVERVLDVARLTMSLRILSDINEMVNRYRESVKAFSLSPKYPARQTLVSVVVPTRNEADKIPILLKSLQRLHHKNLEILVADYMSSDGTPRIARSFGARVIEVDKPGVGYASFLAVNEARGDIIIRTDADAVFPPHVIDYTLDVFERFSRVILLHLGHIYVDSGFIDNLIAFLYDKYWRELWKTTGHFIAFRRELRDIVNFNPNLKYNEDFDFGKRVYEKFGAKAIYYDYRTAVFVSARRIKISGRTRYFLGYVTR
ncbi:MAG: glycosyltransferase [Thermofilaceae archaeon]